MIDSERYCASCGAANQGEAETCFACGMSLKITLKLPEIAPGGEQRLLKERFRILAQVGSGGFSAVYRAVDTHYNDHLVAIKAISLTGLTPQEIIEATDAFNREVALLTHLKHPGLPRIYSHFADAECWYMVMDFIEGSTLERCLERADQGRLPVGEALDIGQSLCAVLEYLHSRQPPVIFRDLKPGNIMIRADGHITLIDFGIARHYKAGQARDTIPFGSPGYAAPEQYGRAQTTPRSDIYSLGAILHQLLTGDDPAQTPFHFAPLSDSLDDHPARAELDALIARMVSMDTQSRPASVTIVRQHLERISRDWLATQKQGLRARSLPLGSARIAQQVPAAVGAMNVRPYGGGAYTVGGVGQAQVLVRPAPSRRQSSAAATAPYWSAPPPKKAGNRLAIASLVLSLIGIFTIPFSFIGAIILAIKADEWGVSGGYPLLLLPFLLLMCLPSILAIVLGLRARIVTTWLSVKDMAAAGIAIGFIIAFLYAGAIALFLIGWLRLLT